MWKLLLFIVYRTSAVFHRKSPWVFLLQMAALLSALLMSPCFQCTLALSSEGWALLHFHSGIEDDPGFIFSNWSPYDENPCKWFGIQCEDARVAIVNLTGLSLRGILNPELGQMTNLRQLLLRHNYFTGAVPFQLGELEKLEVLDLAYNMLMGELPRDLGNLSSLNTLYLNNNNFIGSIPSELGQLSNLFGLSSSTNKFRNKSSGGINNTGICKIEGLKVADFSENYFEGEVPPFLDHLPCSSFNYNCLSGKHVHQRPSVDCCIGMHLNQRRRLLQSEGSAGGPLTNGTHNGTFNASSMAPIILPNTSTPLQSQSRIAEVPSPSVAPITAPSQPSAGYIQPVPGPAASTQAESSSSPSPKTLLMALASACAALAVIAGIIVLLCYRHKGAAVSPWKVGMSGEFHKSHVKGVPSYSRAELEAACEDFSNIIGFASDIVLFKGTLDNDVEIAVISIRKSAKSWSSKSELIFWKKVENLSHVKHRNLLNLLGYCAEEEPFIRMLVFEYVPNGTLFEHLHNKEVEHLDWATRMRIILGVSHALEYMHNGLKTSMAITKLDTKCIFLTEDFSAKVADFGVWKASSVQKSSKSSREHKNGLDPDERELSDRLAPVLDTNIYDFGVLVLEIVSGRLLYSKEWGSLTEWVMTHISISGERAFVDPSLQHYNYEELKIVCTIALQCLNNDASNSPTMKHIVAQLSSSLESATEPSLPHSSPLLWAEMEILSQD